MPGSSSESIRFGARGQRGPGYFPEGVEVSLLKLAQSLRRGGASAGWLVASEQVSGFQVIDDPEAATLAELRRELAALRTRLESSLVTGSTPASAAVEEARQSLGEAAAGLCDEPPGNLGSLYPLSRAADLLHQAGEQARRSGDLNPTLAQLAVSAATLWSISHRIAGPD